MALINKSGYWYYDTQGSDNDVFVRELREVSMATRIKDWDADPNDYYLIEFKTVLSLHQAPIDQDVGIANMERIRDPNDNCYLILENFHEGFNHIIAQIYQFVIDRHRIPPEKVILYSGALDLQDQIETYCKEHDRKPFGFESYLEFEFSVQSDYEGLIANKYNPDGMRHMEEVMQKHSGEMLPNTLQSKKYDKKFLNFNRRWRLQRPMMTALLKASDLLDKGYVSLGLSDDGRLWDTELSHIIGEAQLFHKGIHRVLLANKGAIETMGELKLDKQDLSINQAKLETTDHLNKMYEDTYFSLVSETIFFHKYRDWEDSCFLSEKIFKAILFKHPFVLIATPNTLKYLKGLGYKTYSPVIDESYDSIEDNYLRMIAILKEVNRLCKLEGEALEDFLKYCRVIAEHNHNVLVNKKQFIYKHL
jgi:hypothetical protein